MNNLISQPRNDNNLFLIACALLCVDALYSIWAFLSGMQLIFGLLFVMAVGTAALFFMAYLGRVNLIAPFTALALRLLIELIINHAGRGGFFGLLGVLAAIYVILCLGGIIRFDFSFKPVEKYDIRCGKPLLVGAAVFALLGLIAVLKCLFNMHFGVTVLYVLDTLCLFGGVVLALIALEPEEGAEAVRDEFLEYARNADLEALIYDDDFFADMEKEFGMEGYLAAAPAAAAAEPAPAVPAEEPAPTVEAPYAPVEEPIAAPEEAPAVQEELFAAPQEPAPAEEPAPEEEEPEEYVDVEDFIRTQDAQAEAAKERAEARRREEVKKQIGNDGLQTLAVIRKMAELRDQGIITDAEFEKKKKELLKRL